MNEERMMILNMVAEGKITPEEGAKLLDVLEKKEPSPKPPFGPSPPWEVEGWGPKFGSGFFGDPFKEDFDTSPKTIPVAEGTRLIVKNRTGSLKFVGVDNGEIEISGAPRGRYKLTNRNGVVEVKAGGFGAALTISVPRTVIKLDVKSRLGEVTAQNLPNTLQEVEINSSAGRIAVDTETITSGTIKILSKVGQIELRLPSDSTCEISALCKMGQIDTNLTLEEVEEKAGFLRGKLNGGGADIRLASNMGQIFIGSK